MRTSQRLRQFFPHEWLANPRLDELETTSSEIVDTVFLKQESVAVGEVAETIIAESTAEAFMKRLASAVATPAFQRGVQFIKGANAIFRASQIIELMHDLHVFSDHDLN